MKLPVNIGDFISARLKRTEIQLRKPDPKKIRLMIYACSNDRRPIKWLN